MNVITTTPATPAYVGSILDPSTLVSKSDLAELKRHQTEMRKLQDVVDGSGRNIVLTQLDALKTAYSEDPTAENLKRLRSAELHKDAAVDNARQVKRSAKQALANYWTSNGLAGLIASVYRTAAGKVTEAANAQEGKERALCESLRLPYTPSVSVLGLKQSATNFDAVATNLTNPKQVSGYVLPANAVRALGITL